MKNLILILLSGLLVTCKFNPNSRGEPEIKVVYDTLRVVERVIDTHFIEKAVESKPIQSENYILKRLPSWFIEANILEGLILNNGYVFDNRLNPLYLEEDFNGDGNMDIVVPIKHQPSQKIGFAIIHGQSKNLYIIGAGIRIKNGLSNDLSYIDIWKINRKKINQPGLDENGEIDKNGPLILENPSIQVEKSEVGGGQIYWDGKEYAYFHQTC